MSAALLGTGLIIETMSPARAPLSLQKFPLADADLCVKCGLCLPHCPTYLEKQHEGDSPRGRISLMQAFATGAIPLSSKLEQHLDGCLGCRACERVCPAKVPFGRLMDAGRAALAQHHPARKRRDAILMFGLTRRMPRFTLGLLLWLYQRSGVQFLVRRFHILGAGKFARLESLLPRLKSPAFQALLSKQPSQAQSTVMLFTGCASELFDQQTLSDASRVLNKIGMSVQIPAQQVCCGAMHQHSGQAQAASQFAHKNLRAFSGSQPVLCSASGCAATLLDYPDILADEHCMQFKARVRDLNSFLLQHWPQELRLKPLPVRIAVHTPCTLKNVVGGAGDVSRLLAKIPQAEIFELDASQNCCGAAGSYFITQPEMADQLLQPKLDAAANLKPDLIVSSNIGCSLHLSAGLRRRGIKAPVLHPVNLLAQQLAE